MSQALVPASTRVFGSSGPVGVVFSFTDPWTISPICNGWKAHGDKAYFVMIASFKANPEFQDFIAVVLTIEGPDSLKVGEIFKRFKSLQLQDFSIQSFSPAGIAPIAERLNQETVVNFLACVRSHDAVVAKRFYRSVASKLPNDCEKAHCLRQWGARLAGSYRAHGATYTDGIDWESAKDYFDQIPTLNLLKAPKKAADAPSAVGSDERGDRKENKEDVSAPAYAAHEGAAPGGPAFAPAEAPAASAWDSYPQIPQGIVRLAKWVNW
jgi:hypothetical protein